MRSALFSVVLLACGGPGSSARSGAEATEACDVARLEAQRAWTQVAREAEAVAPPDGGRAIALEGALERLEEHAAQLRAEPHEVQGDAAFAIADSVMAGLDEVASDIPDSLRQRADDAAEALLTDRSAQGSARATSDAIAVVEEVIQQARPDRAAARTERWGVAELARRAGATADAYSVGASEGDRAASRAEDLPLTALPAERAAAADASREVRVACEFRRALAVPSPQ